MRDRDDNHCCDFESHGTHQGDRKTIHEGACDMTKSSLSSYDLLFQQFDSHTTLLTPNRRLSAYLHQVFKDRQREQPSSCWSTPDILPLTSWLERLWQQSVCQTFKPAPTLLSASQTDTVWETILKHDKENEALLQLSETADMAQSAW